MNASDIPSIFEEKFPSEDTDAGYLIRYLLDRKHVVEYRIATDRGVSFDCVPGDWSALFFAC
jgi:hypothetical protein